MRAPAATACTASVRVASRARRMPASGSKSVNARSSSRTAGNSVSGSTRSHGMPSSRSVASDAASQPSSRRANHATPASTTSAGSISRQRSSARRADRVCHASSPCEQRISLDSPPEPARTWPAATGSTSVTSQPSIASWRAVAAPKTPAPQTITEGTDETLSRRECPSGGGLRLEDAGAHEAHANAPLAGPREVLRHAERMVRVLGHQVAGLPLAPMLDLEHDMDPAAGWRGCDDAPRHPADQAPATHRYPKLDRLQRAEVSATDVRNLDVLVGHVADVVRRADRDLVAAVGQVAGPMPEHRHGLAAGDLGAAEAGHLLAVDVEADAVQVRVGRAGLDEQPVGVDAALGRRGDRDGRTVELRALAAELVAVDRDVAERAPGRLLRVVGAQQAVAVELVVGGRDVLEAEPHRDLDVRVEREAVIRLLEIRGLVALAHARGLLARPRATRAGLGRRRPAQLGHPDRGVAVAMGGHDVVHRLVSEERVLPDLPGLAVEEVRT